MPNNYPFIDANASITSAHSSIVGGSHFPVIKVDTLNTASISGDVRIIGSVATAQGTSVSGTVNVRDLQGASVSGRLGASVIGLPTVTIVPITPSSIIEGIAVLTSTSVTTMVAAAGAGVRNYITDVWVANTGANDTLVTFTSEGGASILGYTIAPTLGGSNLPGLATPIRTPANESFDIQAETATSTLYATVKGYKAA